ncbi:MAG: hypothetical protein HYR80_01705 [Nitrospirae bacterium]|nr:hypothetical protein [Nitrospirota bacterium]MBI3805534.1 hypothetical protein [Candidatus Manganitrophaceae bacterium]
MQKILSGLFLVALLSVAAVGGEVLKSAEASEGSIDRPDRERQEIVRGLLNEFGPGFVMVAGVRYKTAQGMTVKNQQGMASSSMKALSPQMMVELVLEGHLVVQIQIVSLPR